MASTAGGHVASMLQELTNELETASLARVWSQWMLLGATAGGRRPSRPAAQIDPEALLHASLLLRGREPRLDDVLRGWLHANAGLVSVQRVRNLAPHYAHLREASGTEALAWLAQAALTQGKDVRWRALAASSPMTAAFSARARSRAKSPPPALQPAEPHQLQLRLRLGLGVGIKADVVAFLMGRNEGWHSIRTIADTLTYTVMPTRRALDDLANAGFIERRAGRPAQFRADPSRWQGLLALPEGGYSWGGWDERFRFVSDWLTWARKPRRVELTDYVFSVEARELLARHSDVFAQPMTVYVGKEPDVLLAHISNAVRSFSAALNPELR